MGLKEQINKDFLAAFKNGETIKKSVLALVKSKITEAEKLNKNEALSDDSVMKVILSAIKQRKDSVELYIKGGRQELADSEQAEINILEAYLPSQLTEEEIKDKAKQILDSIEDCGNSNKRLGQATGQFNKTYAGQFDQKVLRKVLEELS